MDLLDFNYKTFNLIDVRDKDKQKPRNEMVSRPGAGEQCIKIQFIKKTICVMYILCSIVGGNGEPSDATKDGNGTSHSNSGSPVNPNPESFQIQEKENKKSDNGPPARTPVIPFVN